MAKKSGPALAAQKADLAAKLALVAEFKGKILMKRAAKELGAFTSLMMPDPEGIRGGDPYATRFKPAAIHRFLAKKLEAMAGEIAKPRSQRGKKWMAPRLALSVPPQHGKTQTASICFIAWMAGRNPGMNIMFGTYNTDYAQSIGRKVRKMMESHRFKSIFPHCRLKPDAKSSEYLSTTEDGEISFIGRGGSGSGKPADLLVIDDPVKNRKEAKSAAIIEEVWEWYTDVMEARCHVGTAQVVIHTRWVVDDLIGRLCDNQHPDYDPVLAKMWEYINIPAIQTNKETAALLGLKVGEAIWAERFPVHFLMTKKARNPRSFESLYQGNPTPEDGDFFARYMIQGYSDISKLPKNLLIYGASDHALTEKRENDPMCGGVVGVDSSDNIWVFPDISWEHVNPDGLVDRLITQMQTHRPIFWFAEDDMIRKSLGPSIARRQQETRTYCSIIPMSTSGDKVAKAASIQSRMALGKVFFPTFAPWWTKAEAELLKFPNAPHDDFVDFLGLIGRGLNDMRPAGVGSTTNRDPVVGSLDWIKKSSNAREAAIARKSVNYASL